MCINPHGILRVNQEHISFCLNLSTSSLHEMQLAQRFTEVSRAQIGLFFGLCVGPQKECYSKGKYSTCV